MNSHAGIYASMDFPVYKFREYPKMVKDSGGNLIIVASQKEELDATVERSASVQEDAALVLTQKLFEAEERARKLDEELASLRARVGAAPVIGVAAAVEAQAKVNAAEPKKWDPNAKPK